MVRFAVGKLESAKPAEQGENGAGEPKGVGIRTENR